MTSKGRSSLSDKYLVIYDGVCNFCNGAVGFIINRDKLERFIFSPMQSDFAKDIIERYNVNTVGIDTFMLVKNDRVFLWSDAAMEITKDLTGFWHLFRIFKVVPRPIRDFLYKTFARNRLRLFGGTTICQIPKSNVLTRFRGIN